MNKAIIFVLGAAVGSLVTWRLVKSKYEQISREEIASVKEAYKNKAAETREEPKSDEIIEEPSDEGECETEINKKLKERMIEYSTLLNDVGYDPEVREKMTVKEPHVQVIRPDQFGDEYDDLITLRYFADGVLTDDWYAPIEDVDDTVGEGSLETFGDYEDDTVYVRNDKLGCEFEILRDLRNFFDLTEEELDVNSRFN